ncbi:polyprenol monophosphomannose synthase [Granulicoccus phenolivorans]|uniref:polyprenol monophosphomannose synthase n=1 Tax=Granulicoccus phenolivorans TaxID=266854 RepID=UPI000426348F|nr:polyprenol monophosphomannose synthase [Granulicoccus phenolivorans]
MTEQPVSPDRFDDLGKILVIIPTYNEADNIGMIVTRLREAVPEAHVLVTDDNSPDGTGAIADDMAAHDDHIHVLHRQGKEGLSAAYLASFRWGLDQGYDVLVEHDADGSHQPEQLPRLLEALRGADMVKGSRWVPGGSVVNWPKSREVLSRGGGLWTRLMLGMPIKDVTGGFNAFRASTLRAILGDLDSKGYGIQRDLTWATHQRGMKIVEVPIEFKERERGNSKLGKDVFVEAIMSTTKMGLAHRGQQLRSALRPGRSGQDSGKGQ